MFYNVGMPDDKPAAVFRSFDPQAELEISARNMPHWFQIGAAMFITFRTADSLPKEVLIRWQRELEHWLKANQLPLALAESTVVQKSIQHYDMIEKLSVAQRHEFKDAFRSFFSPLIGRLSRQVSAKACSTG